MSTRTRAPVPSISMVAAGADRIGGHSVEAALLVRALRRDGWQVRRVPIDPPPPECLKWMRSIRGLRTLVNQACYWPRLRRAARADVVHVFAASYWSFLLAPVPAMLVARLAGRRVVLHYHSGEAADHLANWGWRVHPWLRLADEIVVPSAFLRDTFVQHGYAVTVIANIVDLSRFEFRERPRIGPRLLSVRTLEPPYGVDVVIDAFARVQASHPDATLTVAATGSDEPRLRQMVADRALRGVNFVGPVAAKDMPRLYAGADIFVNGSVVDNQPVSVLEAFASGLPVVTTAAGDIPRLVRFGEAGRLVPVGDAAGLADAVLDLLADPGAALELARRARQEMDRHTWPAVREAWRAVYLGRPSPVTAREVWQ